LVDVNPTGLHGAVLALPAAVIIGREIAISALREWMAEIGERAQVAVSAIGKIKTTAQMIALLLLLYREPVGEFPTVLVGLLAIYLAAALTLWSMVIYLRAAWPLLMAERGGDQD
jgi:CDP-diacylglycerol--glycerol-3-phosphate 3-phosphatidyltransferase